MTATTVDIVGDQANVLGASGDFAPAAGETGVTFNDIVFSPFPGGGIIPLWGPTANGGFSFDLLSLNIDLQTDKELALTGTGTVKGTGFDDTFGQWSWSGDTSGGGLFVWSSTTTTIPEPATIAVWSILGLSGLGSFRHAASIGIGHSLVLV